MGYTEVLYVTELVGLLLIYVGYRLNIGAPMMAFSRGGASVARA